MERVGLCRCAKVRSQQTVKTVRGSGMRFGTQLKLDVNEMRPCIQPRSGLNERRRFRGVFGSFGAGILWLSLSFALSSRGEDTLYWNTNTSKVTADIRTTDLFHVLGGISAATGWKV